ncbi:MAG TPA: fumarylacetoacetate hydrolase family protein [Planctomycetota bacterium]|nr:fumarylacetoacetate hydrolase family protein [Planctomycetota bacterium]
MKLIRVGYPGQERPAVLSDDGARIDCSAFGEDWGETFFANDGLMRLARWLDTNRAKAPRLSASERLGSAIARPSKIICIGLNYRDHAQETGAELPKEPVIFFKATTALCGPNDDVAIPRGGSKLDWEVELGIVIGRTCRHVAVADALAHVAGFVLHNDYSERSFQLERSGQWVKGKSCDTFAPVGPWLATTDEFEDCQKLKLWLEVNGKRRQDGSTSNMAFGVAEIVSYLSQFMTLLPGDLISTGTPAGVALGMSTPVFLAEGDVVECGIDGLGSARQKVVRAR